MPSTSLREGQLVRVSVWLRNYSGYIDANFPEFGVALHIAAAEKFSDFCFYERITHSNDNC